MNWSLDRYLAIFATEAGKVDKVSSPLLAVRSEGASVNSPLVMGTVNSSYEGGKHKKISFLQCHSLFHTSSSTGTGRKHAGAWRFNS